MNKLRIGFLSTAGIGRKNWKAIRNSGNCVVSAVASRDAQKSREFIRACQAEHAFDHVPAALDNYEALISSPEVDAIYIPLPTGLRKEFVIRAAAAGKHVLCEKPCGVNAAEVEEMLPRLQGGQILITSRLADWSPAVQTADPLDVLEEREAAAFLLARTESKRRETPADPQEAAEVNTRSARAHMNLAAELAHAFCVLFDVVDSDQRATALAPGRRVRFA